MRITFTAFGFVAASVLLLVSAAMNWRFGYSLGTTELDAHIYGAASAAADGFKAMIPFFVLWALVTRSYIRALAGVALWVICSTYSLTSSLGFSAYNRDANTAERSMAQTQYKDLRAEQKRLRERLQWMPEHRSSATVEAALQAEFLKPIKGKRRTTLGRETKNCTRTNYWSGKLCGEVLNLRKELAIAKEAEKLQARLDVIQAKLDSVSSPAAVAKSGDPQVEMLKRLTGVDQETIQLALTVLVSLLVEVGSGLGFFVVFGPSKMAKSVAASMAATSNNTTMSERISKVVEDTPKQSDIKDVEEAVKDSPVRKFVMSASDVKRFYADEIEKAEGSTITATALYEHYCSWCRANGRKPITLPAFGRQFGELGIQKAKIAGRIRYIGVKLKKHADRKTGHTEVGQTRKNAMLSHAA